MFEIISIGTVAIAAMGLATLVVKKGSERDRRMAESLDKNTTVLNELKDMLYRLNGKLK